jgi:LPXTG-motif cell wall-anchored protein
MELPRGWSPWTLIGLVSLVAAGVLGLRRRRAFD